MHIIRYFAILLLLFVGNNSRVFALGQGIEPSISEHSPPPSELLIIKKRSGKIKRRFKVGKKLAYWIQGSKKKNRGVLAYVGPDSVQFNQHRYAWEEITAVSPGRYHIGLREFMVLLVLAGIGWGGLLGIVGLAYGFGSGLGLLFAPTILFPILASGTTRKFKIESFEFGPGHSQIKSD